MGRFASVPQTHVKKGKASTLKKLIRETQSSDEDEDMGDFTPTALPDSAKPWRADFLNYIDTLEAKLPPGMSIIQWWGVCINLYLYCLLITYSPFAADPHTEIRASVGFSRSRLFIYYGIIGLERVSFFSRRNNHQQTS